MFDIVKAFMDKRESLNLFDWPSYDHEVVSTWAAFCFMFKLSEAACLADGGLVSVKVGEFDVLIQTANQKLFLDDYLILPTYPVAVSDLISAAPAIHGVSEFVPSPFLCTDANYVSAAGDCAEVFYYQFKIVKLYPTWEEFTASLSGQRRRDLKRDMSNGFTLESYDPTLTDLQWASVSLKARFGEDYDYAMALLLFGYALHTKYPTQTPCYRILDDRGVMLGFGYVNHSESNGVECATGHSYVFEPEVRGIGKAWIGLLVQQYVGTNFKFLNVGTGVYVGSDDNVQEGYKQGVSNFTTASVNLAITNEDTELYPPYYTKDGWQYADGEVS